MPRPGTRPAGDHRLCRRCRRRASGSGPVGSLLGSRPRRPDTGRPRLGTTSATSNIKRMFDSHRDGVEVGQVHPPQHPGADLVGGHQPFLGRVRHGGLPYRRRRPDPPHPRRRDPADGRARPGQSCPAAARPASAARSGGRHGGDHRDQAQNEPPGRRHLAVRQTSVTRIGGVIEDRNTAPQRTRAAAVVDPYEANVRPAGGELYDRCRHHVLAIAEADMIHHASGGPARMGTPTTSPNQGNHPRTTREHPIVKISNWSLAAPSLFDPCEVLY